MAESYLKDMGVRRAAAIRKMLATGKDDERNQHDERGQLHAAIAQRTPRDILLALSQRSDVAVIAEFKKASPSAGPIAPQANPRIQALSYQQGGAFMVSCLTEPDDFQGSFEDLATIAGAVSLPVLCKDFTVLPEQIPLARAYGADAVLLIVGLINDELPYYIGHALRSGVTPLVEVGNHEELAIALDAGAPLIGVNARDLTTLRVDNDKVFSLITAAKQAGALVVAASGIKERADVERAAVAGADAVLVGETLMRAADPVSAIRALTGVPRSIPPFRTAIKMCGMTTPEDAEVAAEAGVDCIGVVFAVDSPRRVSIEQARAIFGALPQGIRRVGVFANQTRDEIEYVARAVGLDAVQLHGDESIEFVTSLTHPVIKALRITDTLPADVIASFTPHVASFLLDAAVQGGPLGGTGTTFAWEKIGRLPQEGPFILAGGLMAENVGDAMRICRPTAVDVSSGIEREPGCKDREKIGAFVEAVRAADREVQGI